MYYIVEHPRRGTLQSLEGTDGGRVGRFSAVGSRTDAMRFRTYTLAFEALNRLPDKIAAECQVRASYYYPKDYLNAWPPVDREGNVIRRTRR